MYHIKKMFQMVSGFKIKLCYYQNTDNLGIDI